MKTVTTDLYILQVDKNAVDSPFAYCKKWVGVEQYDWHVIPNQGRVSNDPEALGVVAHRPLVKHAPLLTPLPLISDTEPLHLLTNEQIARVFSLYWGQRYYSMQMAEVFDNDGFANIGFATMRNIREGVITDRKLILTPPDAISDKDAIAVAELMDGVVVRPDIAAVGRGKTLLNNFLSWEVREYLILKGYAVPLFFGLDHPCNDKNAIQLGIALDAASLPPQAPMP